MACRRLASTLITCCRRNQTKINISASLFSSEENYLVSHKKEKWNSGRMREETAHQAGRRHQRPYNVNGIWIFITSLAETRNTDASITYSAIDCQMNLAFKIKSRKGGNCNALQLKGCPTSCQSFRALITRTIMHQYTNSWLRNGYVGNWWALISVFAKFVLHMRRHCCFWASGQNSDIAIRFSDPNFQKQAIIWRSHDVFRCLIVKLLLVLGNRGRWI